MNPEFEEIVVQYGSCTVIPSKVKSFSLLPGQQFHDLVAKARLIIAHCGEGTIDLLAQIKKPFILVPRQYDIREHVDDRQKDLGDALKEKGINVASSIEDLEVFLNNPLFTSIEVSPAIYYANASAMLERLFAVENEQNASNTNIDFVPSYV